MLLTRIVECLKMYKISEKFINFISETMKNMKVKKNFNRARNPGLNLPWRHAVATTTCNNNDANNYIHRKWTEGYKPTKSSENSNHFMYMDDISKKQKRDKNWTLILTIKIYSYDRKEIEGINIWAVPLVRYSVPFFKWITEVIRPVDQRRRNLMTMHKVFLHSGDEKVGWYAPRKEGRRGFDNIESCVDASIRGHEDDIKNWKEIL